MGSYQSDRTYNFMFVPNNKIMIRKHDKMKMVMNRQELHKSKKDL